MSAQETVRQTVPLFIAKTSVESQRSSGYSGTHSAVNEFVDNSIEAGATEVRVYYVPQREGRKLESHDIIVLDNGRGMDPELLWQALAFGGGDRFDRKGIGRFGYGLPNAAISQGLHLDVYTWQRPNEVYKAELDVDRIKNGDLDGIEYPELEDVPDSIKRLLAKPIGGYPKGEEQEENLLLSADWPDHGTLVVVTNCDRLSFKQTRPFVEHSWELGRIYRYKLLKGVRIYVNNRLIEPVDPLYLNLAARHSGAAAWGDEITVEVPLFDPTLEEDERKKNLPTLPVVARFSLLPEAWMKDDTKVNRNQRHLFYHHGMSVLRAEREMEITLTKLIGLKESHVDAWWGGEIHVPPGLDEAFGISNNKQGIHPKAYVKEHLGRALRPAISRLRETVAQRRKEQREARQGGEPTFTERRAAEAEKLLGAAYTIPSDPQYQAQVEQSLREFAKRHCRTGETPEMAYERIKRSTHLLEFEHSPEGPFYRVDNFGRHVVTYINTAHKFYDKIWLPLGNLVPAGTGENGGAGEGDPLEDEAGANPQSAVAMLLITIARVELSFRNRGDEAEELFRTLRSDWSTALRTFLSNLS